VQLIRYNRPVLKYLLAGAFVLVIAMGGAFIAISSSGGEASSEGVSYTDFSYNTDTQTGTWSIRIESKAYANLTLGIKANPGESMVNLVTSAPDSICAPALPLATNASCTMPATGVLTLSASSRITQRCTAFAFGIPSTVVTPPTVSPPLPPTVGSGSSTSLDANDRSVANTVPGNPAACARTDGLKPSGQSPLAPANNTNTGPIKRGRPGN
jgi:hypothetical protein